MPSPLEAGKLYWIKDTSGYVAGYLSVPKIYEKNVLIRVEADEPILFLGGTEFSLALNVLCYEVFHLATRQRIWIPLSDNTRLIYLREMLDRNE